MYLETIANMESSNQQMNLKKMFRHNADEYMLFLGNLYVFMS